MNEETMRVSKILRDALKSDGPVPEDIGIEVGWHQGKITMIDLWVLRGGKSIHSILQFMTSDMDPSLLDYPEHASMLAKQLRRRLLEELGLFHEGLQP